MLEKEELQDLCQEYPEMHNPKPDEIEDIFEYKLVGITVHSGTVD